MVPLIKLQVVNGSLCLNATEWAKVAFGKDFSRLRVKGKITLRECRARLCTRVYIASRRPSLPFSIVTIVACENPVGPRVNQFWITALGLEVVYFSSSYGFTVPTESPKWDSQVWEKCPPVGIARSVSYSLSVVLNPSKCVNGTNWPQSGGLRSPVYPVHCF